MTLDSIHIYPVKGLRGFPVPEAVVEPWGLQGDRRWMVVDSAGRYLTQRDLPGMARVAVALAADGITLSRDGAAPLHVPLPASAPAEVKVWRDQVPARDAGPDAASWLSDALGHPCRLVHMADPARARPVDPAFAGPGDRVSFADGFPLLAVNAASLDDLNARLAQPVPMDRFRPNLVVSGAPAWTEDGWATLHVGPVPFRGPKTCARCVVVTTDQATGSRPRDREPLRTLAAFRRDGAGRVVFGMNLIPDGGGRIRVGMGVRTFGSPEAGYLGAKVNGVFKNLADGKRPSLPSVAAAGPVAFAVGARAVTNGSLADLEAEAKRRGQLGSMTRLHSERFGSQK